MGLIATKQREQSTILAYELFADFGFCRKEQTIDNSGDTVVIGSVLISLDRGVTFAELDSAAIDTDGVSCFILKYSY